MYRKKIWVNGQLKKKADKIVKKISYKMILVNITK